LLATVFSLLLLACLLALSFFLSLSLFLRQFPNLVGSTQDTDSFDLYEYLGDSWGVVFMHPADYTPVCTTELGEAGKRQQEFAKRNVKLCGFSCNDGDSHKGVSTVCTVDNNDDDDDDDDDDIKKAAG
jgi:AhpC/TSA family